MSAPNETPEYQRGYADAKVTGLLGIKVVQEAGRLLVAAADAEIARLKERAEQAEAALAESNRENEELGAALNAQIHGAHDERSYSAQVEAELSEARKQRETYWSEVERYRDQMPMLESERDALKEQVEAYKDECTDLRFVCERNEPGAKMGQKMLDAGRWAGSPVVYALAVELGEARQQLAAAESALTAEQALSEQMRAALACIEFIDAGGHPSGNCPSCGWSKSMRHRPGCQLSAALALTPTDTMRKQLLEVAEKAFREGCPFVGSWEEFWQASETRRALEEGK